MYNCMDKREIRKFFDGLAPTWDDYLICDEEKMDRILDAARICQGSSVLDVACGTGVMIAQYLKREASQITGIDLSPSMASLCQLKYAGIGAVDVIRGDADSYDFAQLFDCVMIFNAFPHFPDPQATISHLSLFVKEGGTLTVAHDMGRKKLDEHHSGVASSVSHGMMHEDDIAALFGDEFEISVKVSEPDIFIVTGVRLPTAP